MLSVPEEMFDKIFAVNVKAIYLAALEVIPLMRQQGGRVWVEAVHGQGSTFYLALPPAP